MVICPYAHIIIWPYEVFFNGSVLGAYDYLLIIPYGHMVFTGSMDFTAGSIWAYAVFFVWPCGL